MRANGPDSWPARFCDCGDPISKFSKSGNPRNKRQYMSEVVCNSDECISEYFSEINEQRAKRKRLREIKAWAEFKPSDIFSMLPVVR